MLLVLLLLLVASEAVLAKLTKFQTLELALILISTPVFYKSLGVSFKLVALLAISVTWLTYRILKHPFLKQTCLVLVVLVTTLGVLLANGLITTHLGFDRERLAAINGNYAKKILRYRKNATYLPLRLRPIVFSSWLTLADIIPRTLNWLWLDKIASTIGIALLYPLVLGVADPHSRKALLPLILGVAAASSIRQPDTSGTYILLFPFLIYLIVSGMQKINPKLLVPLALFGLFINMYL